ncbi:hypothetical protein [Lactiplantibacillus pentosus]|uniref:hypothetical protein n=1 Tax=Lactiplantibacillus pentosus TaxID=1589 RepID=UPI001CDAADCE|nr:hypothetical protein [Lactiplantibacillus pentosus]
MSKKKKKEGLGRRLWNSITEPIPDDDNDEQDSEQIPLAYDLKDSAAAKSDDPEAKSTVNIPRSKADAEDSKQPVDAVIEPEKVAKKAQQHGDTKAAATNKASSTAAKSDKADKVDTAKHAATSATMSKDAQRRAQAAKQAASQTKQGANSAESAKTAGSAAKATTKHAKDETSQATKATQSQPAAAKNAQSAKAATSQATSADQQSAEPTTRTAKHAAQVKSAAQGSQSAAAETPASQATNQQATGSQSGSQAGDTTAEPMTRTARHARQAAAKRSQQKTENPATSQAATSSATAKSTNDSTATSTNATKQGAKAAAAQSATAQGAAAKSAAKSTAAKATGSQVQTSAASKANSAASTKAEGQSSQANKAKLAATQATTANTTQAKSEAPQQPKVARRIPADHIPPVARKQQPKIAVKGTEQSEDEAQPELPLSREELYGDQQPNGGKQPKKTSMSRVARHEERVTSDDLGAENQDASRLENDDQNPHLKRKSRRYNWKLMLTGVAILVVAAGGALFMWNHAQTTQAEARTSAERIVDQVYTSSAQRDLRNSATSATLAKLQTNIDNMKDSSEKTSLQKQHDTAAKMLKVRTNYQDLRNAQGRIKADVTMDTITKNQQRLTSTGLTTNKAYFAKKYDKLFEKTGKTVKKVVSYDTAFQKLYNKKNKLKASTPSTTVDKVAANLKAYRKNHS